MFKKSIAFIGVLICLNLPNTSGAAKYPDWGQEYLGIDRFENINRKVFLFNGVLNKYAVRPVTVVWSSIMPKYGMDRLKSAYNNILYPRRLASTLIQGDFKAAGRTTARFLTNSTIGLGGMFDPAKRYLKLKPLNEDMEQALAKLKMKSGPYLVVPILSSATPRALLGRALDAALDPSCYVGSPAIAAVKAGFTVNNVAVIQPLTKMLEQNYADPYDIAKKLYGLQAAILNANLDRDEVLEMADKEMALESVTNNKGCKPALQQDVDTSDVHCGASETQNPMPDIQEEKTDIKKIKFLKIKHCRGSKKANTVKISDMQPEDAPIENIIGGSENIFKGSAATDEVLDKSELIPDIILENFNPQDPVTDSMRTALFDTEGIEDSMWGEMSIWNRCFKNRIKTDSVEVTQGREKYKYKYIIQKDKSAPLAIIYPSVGEGINSRHSIIFAKIFYDEGYSVVIQGSAFHYDFVKSMPEDFRPGIPSNDAKYLKLATSKIINSLEEKYGTKFNDKIVLGTSYGAMTALFLADVEQKENSMNVAKFISINPPVELLYTLRAIDDNSENWNKNPNNLKERTSVTAAKILQTVTQKNDEITKIETLPFSIEESKLITGFILHQKLTDLLFAIENIPLSKKTDFYERANDTNYRDYAQKYLLDSSHPTLAEFSGAASLYSIKNYLQNAKNYRIYHAMDDYLVDNGQLRKLKEYTGAKMKLIDHGAHLGFLYRNEFIDDLKKEISLKEKPRL